MRRKNESTNPRQRQRETKYKYKNKVELTWPEPKINKTSTANSLKTKRTAKDERTSKIKTERRRRRKEQVNNYTRNDKAKGRPIREEPETTRRKENTLDHKRHDRPKNESKVSRWTQIDYFRKLETRRIRFRPKKIRIGPNFTRTLKDWRITRPLKVKV